MTETTLRPAVVEDHRATDGRLVLALDASMTVIHEPDAENFSPPISEYTLRYTENGVTHVLPLRLVASVETR